MYIRFVIADIDEESERLLGLFHAVRNLRDEGRLHADEEEQHDRIREWFDENLQRPTRFNASSRRFFERRDRGLSWFKDSAQEHIERICGLVAILQNHGVPVQMLQSRYVGYVVYEDEYQIVAEPFADMRC